MLATMASCCLIVPLALCLLLSPSEQARLLPDTDAVLPTLEISETRTSAGEGRFGRKKVLQLPQFN